MDTATAGGLLFLIVTFVMLYLYLKQARKAQNGVIESNDKLTESNNRLSEAVNHLADVVSKK